MGIISVLKGQETYLKEIRDITEKLLRGAEHIAPKISPMQYSVIKKELDRILFVSDALYKEVVKELSEY